MSASEQLGVLAVGPHPDDVEIACGGTLLLLRQAGIACAIVDLTRGEMGSRGTAEDRDREAKAAATRLSLRLRRNLGLPDTGVRDDDHATGLLVAQIRELRPQLLLAPVADDVHPDHTAAAHLAARAFFLAGLRHHLPAAGPAFRPRLLLRYPGNRPITATLCIDITAVAEQKAELIRCYQSQLGIAGAGHFVQGTDLLGRAQARDRYWGSAIGVAAAEAFCSDGPLPVCDPRTLFP